MSFMSSFGSNRDNTSSPTPPVQRERAETFKPESTRHDDTKGAQTPTKSSSHPFGMDGQSSQPRVQRERAVSRPVSMINAYQPPLMDISQETLPELQPIFTFLNSHANKLYQEGYFLKLDDQNTRKVTRRSAQLFSNSIQMADTTPTEPGPNALRNWWEQSFHYGMLQNSILLDKMARSFPNSSISQTHP